MASHSTLCSLAAPAAVGLVAIALTTAAVRGQALVPAARPTAAAADTTPPARPAAGRRRRPPATPPARSSAAAPATLQPVEVHAERASARPLVEHVGAATGGALDSLELRALPTDGRDPLALTFTVPGVAQATGFYDTAPVLTIDGQNSLYTQYVIDGLDDNEGVLGGPRVDLPIGALAAVDVRATTYGAEMGRSSNGVVAFITRAGTDEWHGDAVIEGRPGGGFDARPAIGVPDINSTLPNTTAAGFRRVQLAGSAGGPIVRGRTRLFAAGEYTDESQDQPIVTPGFAGGLGSAERVKYKGFARLDQAWSPTQVTTARAAYSDENFVGRGGGFVVPEADNVQHRIGGIYGVTHRSGAPDGGLTNTASAQVATYHWFYPPTRASLSEPTVVLFNATGTGTPIAQVGSSAFQYDEHELQVDLRDVLQRRTGRHTVQVGAELIGGTFRLRGDQTSLGGFYVINDTGGIHPSGRYLSIADIPRGYPVQSWGIDARPQRIAAAQSIVSAFAQDLWHPVRRLALTYGLRWDYDDLTAHGGRPDLAVVQPRLSANWSVTPASALRAGVGIYAGKLPYTIYSDALQFGPGGTTPVTYFGSQGGGSDATVTYGNTPAPSAVAGAVQSQPPREIRARFAEGLRSPRSYQGSLGYEVALARRWGISVDGVVSYTFDLPRLWDLNADSYILGPADSAGRPTSFGDQHRPVTPQPGGFRAHTTTNTGGTSHYFGLSTTLRHQLTAAWSADLTWVWSHIQDNTEDINFAATQGNDFAREWADAINDRRHKVDLRSTYRLSDRLTLGGILDYQTGTPINWIAGADLNGSGPAYGDAFVRNADRYFGVGRNSGRLPDAVTLNLSVGYTLPFGRRGIDLRADALNLLNRVNESGFPSGLAGVDPRTQVGRPGDAVTYLIAGPPRQLQFSARYHF